MRKFLTVLILVFTSLTSLFAYEHIGYQNYICKVGSQFHLYTIDFINESDVLCFFNTIGGYQKYVNPYLAPDVKKMMKDTGSYFSLTVIDDTKVVNFYIKSIDEFATVFQKIQ